MLKPEFVKALDLVKLNIIFQAINRVESEYLTSSEISELTELFSKQGILSATDVRRILSKFNIKAENNRNGYNIKQLKMQLYQILSDNDFFNFVV